MLRELEAHNKSPEPSSDSDQEELFVRTERSSQSAPLDPKRKSKMLREIEAHNQSPEPESQPGVATLHDLGNDWGDLSLTRGARKDLESFLNDKPPTARKNLNLKKLMLEEFSGVEKGTKRFYAEDLSDLGLLSYRRQQKCMNAMGEEEGEEEDLIQNVRTDGRSHPQPMPARREMPRKVRKSVRKSQKVQDSAAELVWPTRDEQKGQSPLALFCIFPFPGAKVKRFGYLPPNLIEAIQIIQSLHKHLSGPPVLSLLTLRWHQRESVSFSSHLDTIPIPHSMR